MAKAIEWLQWANLEKASEGGPGAKIYVDELRRNGVRARSGYSAYVGMVMLEIEKGSKTRAKQIIRKAFGNQWVLTD